MNNDDLVDLIRDISDRIYCIDELVNPLISSAFELRLEGILNEPNRDAELHPYWRSADNALEWMNAHYNQVSGVLFAMMLILQQTADMVDRAEVEAMGCTKKEAAIC